MQKTVAAGLITAAFIGALGGRLSMTPTIRRLHRRNNTLADQVRTDPLTGVLNRVGLKQAYAASNDRGRFLIFVDLDMFKAVNDEHGHPAGDQVLRALGARLAELASRHQGWAGRLGGDEFALLLPDCSASVARQAAAQAISAITIDSLAGSVVRGNAGVAYAAATASWSSALTDADIALYHAKKSGQVTLFAPGMTYPQPPAPRRRARDARSTN
ncbi:GGDEF domain-containing protein [Nucisporomicrobium flavum]|uniref:GGDEF domain-containing protein n=1 Tax=Nucisporomicrobium flavum TaxID=2785915 RepID=UPI0018F7C987|nr:GGDEF domain-containing protein [Nucisporomicrobium flavum]